MEIILSILMYVLGAVAMICVGTIFGVAISFVQAASVLLLFSLLVSIVKHF